MDKQNNSRTASPSDLVCGGPPLPPQEELEDPTTPKTIHMTRNAFNNNNNTSNISLASSVNTNSNTNGAPPALSLHTTSDDSGTNRYQRSVPIHRRNGYGFSVTSSTRSVKSVGSSIIDTEDDRSQTGMMSLMSQDYGAIDEKSVVSGDVPRVVPKEDGMDLEIGNDDGEDNDVAGERATTTSSLTVGLMDRYMREMQTCLEKGLREVKEQNRRDHERVVATLQNEANRRAALEGRLHSQILLQSETLIAMEVKLLKLESKVEKREAAVRRRSLLANPSINPSVNFGENRMGSITGGSGGSSFPISRSSGIEHGTIEEEDVFDMREIRVNTNESHSRGSRGALASGGRLGSGLSTNPTNIAVITSGASLASAVTATSFLDGLEAHDDAQLDDEDEGESADGDDEDEELDGSTSTPTQGSRSHFTNLESILLNPIQSTASNENAISTRAVRGDYDGNSSLGTSATNFTHTTVASTIVTATTSGVELAQSTSVSNREDIDSMLGLSPPTATEHRPPRSRSQSPLTVQSAATASVGPNSTASFGTVGTSIISSAAVAPARSFRARRDAAARMFNVADGGRQITNRVVSFTSNEVLALHPEISEAGDSITMPDELDNLSDVADVLAERGRLWRDEYEARLDAIQKRFGGE